MGKKYKLLRLKLEKSLCGHLLNEGLRQKVDPFCARRDGIQINSIECGMRVIKCFPSKCKPATKVKIKIICGLFSERGSILIKWLSVQRGPGNLSEYKEIIYFLMGEIKGTKFSLKSTIELWPAPVRETSLWVSSWDKQKLCDILSKN